VSSYLQLILFPFFFKKQDLSPYHFFIMYASSYIFEENMQICSSKNVIVYVGN